VPVVLLTRRPDSVLAAVGGSWLLWAVGTQSLSVAASELVPAWPSQARLLAGTAVALWCLGTVLYLLIAVLILVRWLAVPVTAASLSPSYWILMGGTAITVLAGARILALPGGLPAVRATAGLVEGASFALWALGTWWIPLLVVLGLWRHAWRRWPLRYEPDLWSIVFPIGMYSAATGAFGAVTGIGFMEPLSRVMLWAAVAAWLAVAGALGRRLASRTPAGQPAAGAASR
jgi:tellurite resistance protein TehA-like permease